MSGESGPGVIRNVSKRRTVKVVHNGLKKRSKVTTFPGKFYQNAYEGHDFFLVPFQFKV